MALRKVAARVLGVCLAAVFLACVLIWIVAPPEPGPAGSRCGDSTDPGMSTCEPF